MTFEQLLEERNVSLAPAGHEHKRPGWIQFDCPFCSRDWRHYRMGYNIHFKYVNCWACGGHSLQDTVSQLLNIPYKEVFKLLDGLERTREEAPPDLRGKLKLP